jgi:hypothetical protein
MSDERRQDERISLRDYVEGLFRHYKEAHSREHELQAESIKLARENMEYRLEGLNRWREQNQDERVGFVSADKFDATVSALRDGMNAISVASEKRFNGIEQSLSSFKGMAAGIGAAVTVFLTILEIFLRFVVKV